jgi:hypothetical protein
LKDEENDLWQMKMIWEQRRMSTYAKRGLAYRKLQSQKVTVPHKHSSLPPEVSGGLATHHITGLSAGGST